MVTIKSGLRLRLPDPLATLVVEAFRDLVAPRASLRVLTTAPLVRRLRHLPLSSVNCVLPVTRRAILVLVNCLTVGNRLRWTCEWSGQPCGSLLLILLLPAGLL